jgi:hypothetical protein
MTYAAAKDSFYRGWREPRFRGIHLEFPELEREMTAEEMAYFQRAEMVEPGRTIKQGFLQAVDFVRAGMEIGRACRPLMGTLWEDGWDKPVDRWWTELGITPIASGPTSWYTVVPVANE